MIEGRKDHSTIRKPVLEDIIKPDGENDLDDGNNVIETDDKEDHLLHKINTLVIPDSHASSQKSNSDIIQSTHGP